MRASREGARTVSATLPQRRPRARATSPQRRPTVSATLPQRRPYFAAKETRSAHHVAPALPPPFHDDALNRSPAVYEGSYGHRIPRARGTTGRPVRKNGRKRARTQLREVDPRARPTARKGSAQRSSSNSENDRETEAPAPRTTSRRTEPRRRKPCWRRHGRHRKIRRSASPPRDQASDAAGLRLSRAQAGGLFCRKKLASLEFRKKGAPPPFSEK